MKKLSIVVLVSFFLSLLPSTQTVYADSNPIKEVAVNSLYGALVGTLIGAATLAFDKSSDDRARITKGAAIGLVLGATYGVAKLTHAIAEIKDGTMTVQIPTIQWTPASANSGLDWKVDLLHFTF